MDDYESLSHSKWECKYHVVFIPKCRRKTLYGELRQHLGFGAALLFSLPPSGGGRKRQPVTTPGYVRNPPTPLVPQLQADVLRFQVCF